MVFILFLYYPIKKGGIIGLAFVGEFLCKDNIPKVDDVIRHIDYFIKKLYN
jgi:microsomal dipeptidase-like Zn-dependent dipeptidase